ncbi:hypothetical protein ANN_01598 [Periplaneta americana]|uniref:Uncharacterized protein n=1 Tax=Periplaneta americana TaxID=6978 RepID=A0ABQ8TU04_PERAM|nr:hypothetical protein ANN_01598 [Periplaneta americana]
MSPGSNTESYPAFAHIGLRENPGKTLNQVTCPDRESNPGHLVSRPEALTKPRKTIGRMKSLNLEDIANDKRIRWNEQMHDDLHLVRAHQETAEDRSLWRALVNKAEKRLLFEWSYLIDRLVSRDD